VAVAVCYDRGAYDVDDRVTVARCLVMHVSIFKLPAKYLETMLKRRRTLLCVAGRVGASMAVVVYCDRRVQISLLSTYERSNLATQRIDFWAPYKRGRNYAESVPYVAVCCRAGRGTRVGLRSVRSHTHPVVESELKTDPTLTSPLMDISPNIWGVAGG